MVYLDMVEFKAPQFYNNLQNDWFRSKFEEWRSLHSAFAEKVATAVEQAIGHKICPIPESVGFDFDCISKPDSKGSTRHSWVITLWFGEDLREEDALDVRGRIVVDDSRYLARPLVGLFEEIYWRYTGFGQHVLGSEKVVLSCERQVWRMPVDRRLFRHSWILELGFEKEFRGVCRG